MSLQQVEFDIQLKVRRPVSLDSIEQGDALIKRIVKKLEENGELQVKKITMNTCLVQDPYRQIHEGEDI